nr:zinc-binding dehydrogenase [Frederiksenia canicola]
MPTYHYSAKRRFCCIGRSDQLGRHCHHSNRQNARGKRDCSVSHAKGDVLLQKGADFVIATKEDDVTAKLLEITNGKGVNLVFDPVGGKEAAKIINAMTQDGKYIIYGALSHDDIAVPVFPILGKHLTVRELFEITTVPEKLAQAKKFVFDGLASGQLKLEIDKVFAFDEMAEAHRYMESNAQIGKILVKV